MIYPNIIKQELDAAIAQAIVCRGEYINTLASFTRQRKLPMETVIKLLLSMQGGSLNKELHDSGIGVTASAFVQRRAKVSSSVFHDIADRGYESYNMFAHLLNRENVDFLIRVKQDRAAMREIQKLPMTELDCNVSFTVTTTQTNEDKRENRIFLQTGSKKGKINGPNTRITRWDFPSPYPMSFRVVRFLLDTGEYETIATSLPHSFTIDDIKELYHNV